MLTTLDNPYNPFTHYDEWFVFDTTEGYYTNAYLARVTFSSDEMSEADQMQAIEQGMDDILEFDQTGMFVKVTESTDFTKFGPGFKGEGEGSP